MCGISLHGSGSLHVGLLAVLLLFSTPGKIVANELAPGPIECSTLAGAGASASDVTGAVGPANFIVATSTEIAVYQKSNCVQKSKQTLKTLFSTISTIPAAESLTGPRVLFDRVTKRFFLAVVSVNKTNTDQYLYFAVSTDNTGLQWHKYQFDISRGIFGIYGAPCKRELGDSFKLFGTGASNYANGGVSTDRWLVTGNQTSVSRNVTGTIITIAKSGTLEGQPPSPFSLRCIQDQLPNLQPPIVQDSSLIPVFLSVGAGSGNSVKAVSIARTTPTEVVEIPIPAWTAPPDVTQPNGQKIGTGRGSFGAPSIQRGDSIWQVHSVNVAGQARWRVYKFLITTCTRCPFDVQRAFTFTPEVAGGFNPSMAVADNGRAFVTFSHAGPRGVSTVMSQGPHSSKIGWKTRIIKTSAAQFTSCSTMPGQACRWSRSSSTQIDPSSNGTFAWGFNQLITGPAQRNWTTHAAKVGRDVGVTAPSFTQQ